MKSCELTTISEDSLPTHLQWLILTNNKITAVPRSIGKLTKLQKLSLAGNKLADLPVELQACQNLELIRLGANNLKTAPDWLFNLPRLAWYGGVNHSPTQKLKNSPEISYADIKLADKIGSSPSSEIFQASLRTTGEVVAVKLYASELTSDGWSIDDLRMGLAAGPHPNLIPILGKLVGHIEQKIGVVMKLIPLSFHPLGLPPSLKTCTRDTFPPETIFPLPFILNVLRGVASACQHLHNQGIIHGDLYAHNILVNDLGECYVGDFGAASFYDSVVDHRPEQIEVRAFGYLIEDLLDYSSDPSPVLEKLKNSCLSLNISTRPRFAEIIQLLHSL